MQQHLGTTEYSRLRLGVGSSDGRPLTDHVLGVFRVEERDVVEAMLVRTVEALHRWLREEDVHQVMSWVNTKEKHENEPSEGTGE